MPNWCYHSAEISHDDPAKISTLIQTILDGRTFEHFLPIPPEVIGPTDPDLEARGIKAMGGTEYQWRVDHWGTKWDICYPSIEKKSGNSIFVSFETAWSPPLGAFEAMKAEGYKVRSEYWEEGGFYVGIWDDGDSRIFEPDQAPEDMKHLAANVLNSDEEEEDDDPEAA